jgi:hypothetical protein
VLWFRYRGLSCSLSTSMRGRIWSCADTSFVVKNLVLVGFANIEIVSGVPRTLYFYLLSALGRSFVTGSIKSFQILP